MTEPLIAQPDRLQLLGRAASINVRKVLWLCDELSLPIDHTEWGSGSLSLRAPEFLALNPNAMIPVLIDDGFVLWESNAICRYLAGRQGRSDLLPEAPQPRARVEQWMDWQATELNNAWRYAFLALVRRSPAHQDAAALEASRQSWNRHMGILDDALAGTGAYITGDTFTLADIVLGLSANRWLMTPIERPDLPAVAAYVERLAQRAAFLRHGRNGVP